MRCSGRGTWDVGRGFRFIRVPRPTSHVPPCNTSSMARRGAPKRAGTKESAAERVDDRLGRFAADGAIPLEVTGRKVAIEGGIPNETVRLALIATGRKDRPRAEVVSVLDPSPERVTPRCKVIDVCGGCKWQHLSQPGQLVQKAA